MSNSKIRFSSDILRRLGEELNPSPDRGVIELVKNSYDADALETSVELSKTNKPGGTIIVTDNGDGMTREQVNEGWLVLGRSLKNTNQRTRLKRIPVGNKGLGRLAALRLGRRVILRTRPREEKNIEYEIEIDWQDYDDVELVDDVTLTITSKKTNKENGTDVIINDLLVAIDKNSSKKLAREMILLADPFGDNPSGFQPKLISPEFIDLQNLVEKRYFDDAEYFLEAVVNNTGKASAEVKDWKGNTLWFGKHKDIAAKRKGEHYRCPSAQFNMWMFILSSESFTTRKVTLGEVRTWLSEFGGVHFFENGIRVSPYGNPGHDWLELNLRRSQSPEERPSTNNSIGRISIQNLKGDLIQKTDRSGFIEGDSFLEIRNFAQDVLEWVASRRLEAAEIRRTKQRKEAETQAAKSDQELHEVIKSVPKNLPQKDIQELEKAVRKFERSKQKEILELEKEVQLYRTLSTAGITAATFAHESSGNPIKVIGTSIKAIERRGVKLSNEKYKVFLKPPVDTIKSALAALAVLGKATLKLLEHEKRRSGKVEIHKVLNNILVTFEPFLIERDVELKKNLVEGNPFIRGSEAAIESVFTNLINNSLAAFEDAGTQERIILIKTFLENKILQISFLDNGPGIQDISVNDIWLPGRTTRPNGTGLGLTIVKDTVIDLGGSVAAKEKSEIGGAEIIIELPVLGH